MDGALPPRGASPPDKIAFFLTGHGFGHGVRNSAIMDALPPHVEVEIFTSLPEAFFREELRRPFRVIPCEIDCGCLQTDTVEVDIEATLARYLELDGRRHQAIAEFSARLKDSGARLVIGDAPPLAFPIAKAAGVPSWALYNFTWTEIYRPYVEKHPRYGDMLKRMEADYAKADRHMRMYPGLSHATGFATDHPSPSVLPPEDAGIICRPGTARRREFAERFGLDPEKKWALIYVGSFGLDGVAWSRLDRFTDWEFMGLYPLKGAAKNYRVIKKDLSFRYADLTASSDLVLGKLGYGLVAECLALAKPIAFLGRKDFVEFPMLKHVIEARGMGLEVSLDAFRKMEIGPALEALSARRLIPEKASGVAKILEKMGFHGPRPGQ